MEKFMGASPSRAGFVGRGDGVSAERFEKTFMNRQAAYGAYGVGVRGARGGFNRPAGAGERASEAKRKLGESHREASRSRRLSLQLRALRLLLLSLVIFVGLLTLVYKLFFVVSSVSVEGAGTYTPVEIIESSGIENGVNLYSFRSSTVKNRITFACPFVSDVDLTRNIPNSIVISVSEDKVAFVAQIYGNDILLSDSLRVLGLLDAGEAAPEGVMRLSLPDVKQALSGRALTFFENRSEKITRAVLTAVSSSELDGRITSIDIRDPYNIELVCDGKYLLSIGDESDISLKLRTAARVLEDEMFKSDDKMRLNLQTPGKTSVIIDNGLSFD